MALGARRADVLWLAWISTKEGFPNIEFAAR
jgi:hypothetical protein